MIARRLRLETLTANEAPKSDMKRLATMTLRSSTCIMRCSRVDSWQEGRGVLLIERPSQIIFEGREWGYVDEDGNVRQKEGPTPPPLSISCKAHSVRGAVLRRAHANS